MQLTLSDGTQFNASPCPICPAGSPENLRVDSLYDDEHGEFDAIECLTCLCQAPAGVWNRRAGALMPFQSRVNPWMYETFGPEIANDRSERNHRFLEESLELVQACGCTFEEVLLLANYVYERPIGEPHQEVGGVMVTLAALCLAQGLDMHVSAEAELQRVWQLKDQIREKQRKKPRSSPLPIAQGSSA